MKKNQLAFKFATVIFVSTILSSSTIGQKSISNEADSILTRTINYENKIFDEQLLKEEFDTYTIKEEENGDIQISATKEFDMSLLEGIDLVGLDQSDNTFLTTYSVDYDESEDVVFLTAKIIGSEEIEIVDKVPGLFCYNKVQQPDVLFIIEDEQLWLSDLGSDQQIEETGWLANLFKNLANKVTSVVIAVADAVRNVVQVVVQSIVKTFCKAAYKLIGRSNSAAVGAWFLQMEEETEIKSYSNGTTDTVHTGIYHSTFDCWQQYFGYTDLYDIVFDAGTSMRFDKFQFTVNGQDYVLWCWKGDYLNLGAGCELGIYKRWEYCDNIWKIDKNLALTMTLSLDYKNQNIIDYKPSAKQWWITGFNSNYDDVNRDDLCAKYNVTFITKGYSNTFDRDLWNAFVYYYGNGQKGVNNNKWSNVVSSSKSATLIF